MIRFGTGLRLLRGASGRSLTAVAHEVGVSPAYLSRVENGHEPPPTPERLVAIATALGLPNDALVDLVRELRPDALSWLGETGSGRRLAAELRRRQLSEAQLARVIGWVQAEFPLPEHRVALAPLLAEPLREVTIGNRRDGLELASLRVGGDPRVVLAQVLATASDVGGGLLLAHARGVPALAGALLLLGRPLPDGIRAILVVAGPERADLAPVLVAAVGLAAPGRLDRLLAVGSEAELRAELRRLE